MRVLSSILAALLLLPAVAHAQRTGADPRAEIAAFNDALDSATWHMDNAATLALWEDEGVSLLPSTRPLVGKTAIAAFMNAVTAQMGHGRMETFDNRCQDIETTGDWASEWCLEHQIVLLPDGKRFDGWGKLLLVLHRGTDGRWRIRREMWNQASAADAGGA